MRLLFNMVEDDSPIELVFETLLAYCEVVAAADRSWRTRDACMGINEIYPRVRGSGAVSVELAADASDYKAQIAKATPTAEKLALAQKLATQRLARGVVPELDACFAALDLQSCLARAPDEAELPAA